MLLNLHALGYIPANAGTFISVLYLYIYIVDAIIH